MKVFNIKKAPFTKKGYLHKVVWGMGTRAFLLALVLVLLSIYFGQFLFYQYVSSANSQDVQPSASYARFKEKEYRAILKTWEAREGALLDSSMGSIADPFER